MSVFFRASSGSMSSASSVPDDILILAVMCLQIFGFATGCFFTGMGDSCVGSLWLILSMCLELTVAVV